MRVVRVLRAGEDDEEVDKTESWRVSEAVTDFAEAVDVGARGRQAFPLFWQDGR